jgi:hypothetical protein
MKPGTESAKAAFRYFGGFAALFILVSGKTFAQQISADEKPVLSVNYLKEENGFYVFNVTVSQLSGKKAILKIVEMNAELLYSELISGDSYTKAFRFSTHEIDTVEFRVISGKEIIRKSFKLKSKVEEVVEITEPEEKK